MIEALKKITLCAFVLLGFSVSHASTSIDQEVKDMGFEYVEFDGQMVPVGSNVTMDQATEYVEKKGYELINFLVKIAKPITLVVMVVCGLMAIMSGLTGGQNSGSWIWAGVIAAICYVGAIFSPVILSMIVNFVNIN